MFTMVVGLLLVAASALGFGYALFGHRPVPQPAMALAGGHLVDDLAEPAPSIDDDPADHVAEVAAGGVLQAGWARRLLQREPTADHQPGGDVTLSRGVRVRSALLLALVVVGLAAAIGTLISVVLVGAVLLVT
ncbi:MAG: hypothetical protein ACK4V6_05285 [Microthrixaceae bacterium]